MQNHKSKIVRIISRLNVGGPSFQVLLLTANLDKNRYDSILICGKEEDGEGNMFDLARSMGIQPVVIPEIGREVRPFKNLIALFKLITILRREKPDLVHTHLAMAGFIGRLAALISGRPKIVHTFHGHSLHGYWGKFKTRFFSTLERISAGYSDCLIAVSDKVREDLIKSNIIKPEKSVTIHLGLQLERFLNIGEYKGQLRRELGIPENAVLVGIIARLVPVKNHRLLVDAALRIKNDNVRYLVVGDGYLREELREYIRSKGLDGKFIFTGFRKDLERIYSDLDISVLSSLNEGLPVAVIESMAAGIPVAATDVGGIRELIDDGVNGFIVPSRDTRLLADKIEVLIEDKGLRNELGRKAKSKVYPYFNHTRLVKDIDKLYTCLLKNQEFNHIRPNNPIGNATGQANSSPNDGGRRPGIKKSRIP
jgi:glycosyltransferase involved in cell wall biosynthesis